MRRFGRGDLPFLNDLTCGDILAVESPVRFAVRTKGRALQRNAGEYATEARVAQHFSPHVYVGVGLGFAALGSGSNGGVGAEFYLAVQETARPAVVHHQDHEISGFSADLETDTATFERHHSRCAPRAIEIMTSAANHDTTPVVATDHESCFHDRWKHDDTSRLVEQVSRHVVRNVENFFEDGAGVTNPVIFFLVVRGLREGNPRPSGSHKGERSQQTQRANFVVYCFHDGIFLLFLLYFLNVVIRNGPLNSKRQVPQQSTKRVRKRKKIILAMPAAATAIPPNLNKAASKATMKNLGAQRSSILTSWRNVKFNEQWTESGSPFVFRQKLLATTCAQPHTVNTLIPVYAHDSPWLR